ncbi:hypothetical protein ACHAXT_000563 [Thalassiosira profunda]
MGLGAGGKMLGGKMLAMRGGKMLRPEGDDSDDDEPGKFGSSSDSSSSEDSDDEDVANKKPASSAADNGGPGKKPAEAKKSANLSSSDESSDDDDEELMEDAKKAPSKRSRSDDDDSSEEEEEERKKTKKKRPKISFFDEEAEASDDDEDDEKLRNKDVSKEYADEEAKALMAQQDRRREREGGWLDNLGGLTDDREKDDADVARIARELEERHRRERRAGAAAAGEDGLVDGPSYASAPVSQQSLVPSVSDPNLWMFSCPTGKEQELVYQIMNKCVAFAKRGRPLGITSVVTAQTKGRIYVESYSEPAVIEAVQGVRGLMQYTMTKVPISDMTTVMTVVPKKVPVKKNDWVRMTRGHFKGDLALVRHVRDSGLKCVVQCVPRLDLTLGDLPPDEARVRRRTVKPPQKFFNAQEIASMGKHLLRQRFPGLADVMCDYFDGNYYSDGYLLKEVTIGTVVKPCTADDPPTLDELQRFRRKSGPKSGYDDGDDDEENEGSQLAGSLLSELSELQGKTGSSAEPNDRGLMIGDTIEVIEGDLVGMQGKIMSLDGTTVKVRPNNDAALAELGGMDEVEFLMNQVRKFIAVGAHVKVTDGRYANETGVVVAVETIEGEEAAGEFDCTAVVLTDMTHKEISVRTSQLQESAEIASGQDKLAGYELHDLVVLSGGGSANEVGVIVRVGREEFTVVNNHGIAREARPEELRGKRNKPSDRAVALDVQANQIRCGDLVTIVEGPHKGKTATIKRMSRAQLFLYSQFRSEHSGIFVVRSRSCVLAGGASKGRGAGAGGRTPGESPFSTPSSQMQRGPMRGDQDDSLKGKTVRIQAGQWKGYLGTVCHSTATHVQVELHSRLKKVMVVKERVHVVGDKFGATTENAEANVGYPGAQGGFLGGATPMHGGATPMLGGATPMHGGATPMHGGSTPTHTGMSDDIWRPGGSIDREQEGPDDGGTVTGSVWSAAHTKDDNSMAQSTDPFGDTSATAGASGFYWTPNTGQTDSVVKHDPDAYSTMQHEGSVMDSASTIEGGDDTAAVWFMERVCVELKKNSAKAVIKEVNGSNAVVEMEGDKSSATVRNGEVTMVAPQEHDMVLVTGGADVGVEGELVCIDGTDAILKESNEQFKIVDFVHLAKIAAS